MATRTTSLLAARLVKANAWTRLPMLLALIPMLLVCNEPARPDEPGARLSVVPVLSAVDASTVAPDQTAETADCTFWSLDRAQAKRVLQLSRPLREGELHSYDWSPCAYKGKATDGLQSWDFEINAAGTTTLRGNGKSLLLGCAQPACEPLLPGIMPRETP